MGFIDDEQGSGAAGDIAQSFVETVIGQNHADIGHDGFGQNTSHITGCQGGFQSRNIIELDNFGQFREVMGFTDEGGSAAGLPWSRLT